MGGGVRGEKALFRRGKEQETRPGRGRAAARPPYLCVRRRREPLRRCGSVKLESTVHRFGSDMSMARRSRPPAAPRHTPGGREGGKRGARRRRSHTHRAPRGRRDREAATTGTDGNFPARPRHRPAPPPAPPVPCAAARPGPAAALLEAWRVGIWVSPGATGRTLPVLRCGGLLVSLKGSCGILVV